MISLVTITDEYYVEEDTDLGPSVHSVVRSHIQQIFDLLVTQVDFKIMVDVETKVQ